jgi:hypothetical protein
MCSFYNRAHVHGERHKRDDPVAGAAVESPQGLARGAVPLCTGLSREPFGHERIQALPLLARFFSQATMQRGRNP